MGGMPIGAQISTSGGLVKTLDRAAAIGAECLQVFLSAPQQWRAPTHSLDEARLFVERARQARIGPNFAHAIYLINLASPDPLIRARSIAALTSCLDLAARCGLAGVVVHVGSGKGQAMDEAERHVVSAIEQVLCAAPAGPLLLETSAGSGNTLGATMEQLGRLIERLGGDRRLALCLDTAHTFASGYDLRTDAGLDGLLDEIDRYVGLGRLRLLHANDSRAPLGSAVDRHANIGAGELGEATFARLLARPVLADLPWVMEVPGYEGRGPDARSIETLKRLAGRAAPVLATRDIAGAA